MLLSFHPSDRIKTIQAVGLNLTFPPARYGVAPVIQHQVAR